LLLNGPAQANTDPRQALEQLLASGCKAMTTAQKLNTHPQTQSQSMKRYDKMLRLSLKDCRNIGQKSDKAKCKSLKRELLNCEGKVLQNLNSRVRFRPAPPTPFNDESVAVRALF
jgi:IS30 family transposase